MKKYRITKVEHHNGHVYWIAERRVFSVIWVRVSYQSEYAFITHPKFDTYEKAMDAIRKDADSRIRPIKTMSFVDPTE